MARRFALLLLSLGGCNTSPSVPQPADAGPPAADAVSSSVPYDLASADSAPMDLAARDLGVTDSALLDLAGRDFAISDFAASDLTVADFTVAVADIAVADFTVAVADLATADIGVADFAIADIGVADFAVGDLAVAAPDLPQGMATCGSSAAFGPASLAFALPAGYGYLAFSQSASNSSYCTNTDDPAYFLMDMSGDGKPDLVVTEDCDPVNDHVGTDHWLVYLNTGTGFSPNAQSFALPPNYGYLAFASVASGSSYCTNTNDPAYELRDLDGDGRPDLVVTEDCDPVNDHVGTDHWLLYLNTGTGFSPVGQSFALPPNYGYQAFSTTNSNSPYCTNTNDPAYVVMDVSGDGKPDLVVTEDCDPVNDHVGTDHWLVYLNNGTAFSANGASFALPAGYGYLAFATTASNSAYCTNTNDPAYSMIDLDADGKPDLVVTADCDPVNDHVGTDHWLFFANTGSGFPPNGQSFALPPGYGYQAFSTAASGSAYCTNTVDPAYALIDVDGDRRPDLVVTDSCDPQHDGIGTSQWLAYRNGAGAFGPGAGCIALPPGYGYLAFGDLSANSSYCTNTNDPAYQTVDLDGDGRIDIAVEEDCDPVNDQVGTARWLWYRGGGTP
jgi:hypothetical protein